jgi:hypothetical protein
MPKKRVVTATKTMRFLTTFGTEHSQESQLHAEEREAKRWLQTRFDNYAALAQKYEPGEYDRIVDVTSTMKGTDLMLMKPETIRTWDFTYARIPVVAAIRRLP